MTESGCVFCDIAAGKGPASIVYRDDCCMVFMDTKPVNTGQVLVVPLKHAADLAELDNETAGEMMKIAHNVTAALRKSGLRCDGINLLLADGEAAMQEVFHVHLIVIPRFKGDRFGLSYGPDNFVRQDRAALDDAAAKIRRHLDPNQGR